MDDIAYNKRGELADAAIWLLTGDNYPSNWQEWFRDSIIYKRDTLTDKEYNIERYKIAAALLASEIDRLHNDKDAY